MTDPGQMIREIEQEVGYTSHLIGRSELGARVMVAMAEVPRHKFVPPVESEAAYVNGPLPIGYGQTISQPYIVALMTDLLAPNSDDVMLEVGTGSGYQAAVLSRLVSKVYSVEIVEPLHQRAVRTLEQLGYSNVACRQGDGYFGWPEVAPFDGIIVTAAAPKIPDPLLDQLKPGARMVIPIGPAHAHQQLMLIEKDEHGRTRVQDVLGVVFVPLTGLSQR